MAVETNMVVGMVETLTGKLLFLDTKGKWRPFEKISEVEPAQYSGGIPSKHIVRYGRKKDMEQARAFWAEPYPEMPNVARLKSGVLKTMGGNF